MFLGGGIERCEDGGKGGFIVRRCKMWGIAKENIQGYFVNVNEENGLEIFDFTSDETGLVGIHTAPTHNNMSVETVIVDGINFFPERVDGIVEGEIENP